MDWAWLALDGLGAVFGVLVFLVSLFLVWGIALEWMSTQRMRRFQRMWDRLDGDTKAELRRQHWADR
jgi:hypothetical protein